MDGGRGGGLPSSMGSSDEEEEEKEEEMSLCGVCRLFGEGRLPLGTGFGRQQVEPLLVIDLPEAEA